MSVPESALPVLIKEYIDIHKKLIAAMRQSDWSGVDTLIQQRHALALILFDQDHYTFLSQQSEALSLIQALDRQVMEAFCKLTKGDTARLYSEQQKLKQCQIYKYRSVNR